MKASLYRVAALVLLAQTLTHSAAANANALDRALAQMDPEERAHQACMILGLDKVRKDRVFPHADRMQPGVLGRVNVEGNRVTGSGGAVRADHHWYRISYDCTVSKDRMKATAFTYKVGPEIPRKKWDDIGLWP
jgi:Domain of Unknown Function (DUF930)